MTDKLEWIKSVLKTTPERWLSLTEMLPAELLNAPPAPKEWSAMQCLHHLLDLEILVFPFRMRRILAGQEIPGFDPETQTTPFDENQSPVTTAWKFNQLRQESMQLMGSLSSSDLESQGRHAELGVVTLSELLHEWAAHDLMHTMQAERALMQPFIRGCGPWQRYFEEHKVSQNPKSE